MFTVVRSVDGPVIADLNLAIFNDRIRLEKMIAILSYRKIVVDVQQPVSIMSREDVVTCCSDGISKLGSRSFVIEVTSQRAYFTTV